LIHKPKAALLLLEVLSNKCKLDFVLAAALDCGVAVSLVIIFFCIVLPGANLKWWGNTVYKTTADGLGTPWKKLAPGETFGPATWS
jgi:hypothetical protein